MTDKDMELLISVLLFEKVSYGGVVSNEVKLVDHEIRFSGHRASRLIPGVYEFTCHWC